MFSFSFISQHSDDVRVNSSAWKTDARLYYYDVTWTSCSLKSLVIRLLFNSLYGPTSKKHQSPHHWSFVRGIHRWPTNSLHRGPVTGKKLPFDDVIMIILSQYHGWHSDWRISPGISQSQQREDKIKSLIYNFSWCRVECFYLQASTPLSRCQRVLSMSKEETTCNKETNSLSNNGIYASICILCYTIHVAL